MFTVSLVASATAALLASSLLAAVHGEQSGPCYDPRGDIAPGFYACNPTAGTAACCPRGWACLSNSLCVATTQSSPFLNLTVGEVIRGACTSPRWNKKICGGYCLDEANSVGEMISCGEGLFCCGAQFNDGKCRCPRYGGSGAFTITSGKVQTTVTVSDASFTVPPTHARLVRRGSARAMLSARRERNVGDKIVLGASIGLPLAIVAVIGTYSLVLMYRWRKAGPHPDPWSIDESLQSENEERTLGGDDGVSTRRGYDNPTTSTPPPRTPPPAYVEEPWT